MAENDFEGGIPSLGDLFAMGLGKGLFTPMVGRDIADPDAPLSFSASGLMGFGGAPPVAAPNTLAGTMANAVAAPAVHTRGNEALINKIYEHADKFRTPDYPPATTPVFKPADVNLTKELVPQVSIADRLPPMPTDPRTYPNKGRMAPIIQNEEAIASKIASDLEAKGGGALPFYSTGTVIEGLHDIGGLSKDQANVFMRDWSGQGAATSPRTKTPTNLRNASYLQFLRAQGTPLTSEKRAAEGNRPGFPMMGMHTDLADKFAIGSNDFWTNPKPSTFRENWSGNMADVTADTHNIRAVIDAYDSIAPGTLPRGWFTSDDAFNTYRANKGFPKEGPLDVGGINDSLGDQMINGRKAQTEYPMIQRPTILAAQKMGISPAEAQERMWFGAGERTGLRSPAVTIPDLLNSQIEATAKATGLAPEVILRLWAKRSIPLAANEPAEAPTTGFA